MYDGSKILPALAIFVALAFSPVIYNATTGEAAAKPQLTLPANEKQCIEATGYMRADHMQMLISWRDQVVRQGGRTYVAGDGKQYEISLTGTCLQQCHEDKAEFCDRCHDYAGVTPTCWSCHVAPEEPKA